MFFAAPVIVEEVDERKAVVYVPVGVDIKPGDQLFKEKPIEAPAPAPVQVAPQIIEVEKPRPLRTRQNIISLEYHASESEAKWKEPINSRSKSKEGELNVSYGYNTGRWMPWVSAGSTISKNEGDETRVGLFGLGITLNFIPNEPGNDLIPFGSLGIAGYYGKSSEGISSVEMGGSATQVQFGLMWFPFGELAALTLALSSISGQFDVTGGTAPAAKIDFSSSSLSFGYSLAF